MIKWSEFEEGGVRFEAFLPEHETEAHEWMLRASAHGHILDERRVPLTWAPRFGPDMGDVAAVEAAVEKQIVDVATHEIPEEVGSYEPGACEITPPNPMVHAVLYALIEQFAEAETALGLTVDQSAAYLGLASGASAKGLYPFAVTPVRDERLRRVIALAGLLARDPRVADRRQDLIDATLRDDRGALVDLLAAAGIDVNASEQPD